MGERRLGDFLQEVSNWRWSDFLVAENDDKYSSNEAMIFSLIRACVMQKMEAIRISLHRLDGKPETPVRVEYPKVFYLYPNAKLDPRLTKLKEIKGGKPAEKQIIKEIEAVEPELTENDLPSLSIRETLKKMSSYPRKIPQAIVATAEQIQQALKNNADMPPDDPLVKSVVAAHLLIMAQNRNIGALSEVFDQIDGKLVETVKIIGQDMYITSFSTVAPEGAYLNSDGVVEVEAKTSTEMWARKLSEGK